MADYRKKCKNCGSRSYAYSELYDAYYCKECCCWKEDKCSESDCDFCSKRPSTAIKVANHRFKRGRP